MFGIYNFVSRAGNGGVIRGQYNNVSPNSSSTSDAYGEYTYVSSSNGIKYGEFKNVVSGTIGSIYGDYNRMTGTGSVQLYGVYNDLINTGSGAKYGVRSEFTVSGNAPFYGAYNNITNTGSGIKNGTYCTYTGTGNATFNGINNYITNTGTGSKIGVSNSYYNSGNANFYGAYNAIYNGGTGNKYGTYSQFTGVGSGVFYGDFNNISNTGSGTKNGVYNDYSGLGNAVFNGVYNSITNAGTGIKYGINSHYSGSGNATFYGTYNRITNLGTGQKYGVYTEMITAGTGGVKYGVNNNIQNITASGTTYGVRNYIRNNSNTSTKYGSYNYLYNNNGIEYGSYNYVHQPSTSTSTLYGVYANVVSTGTGIHYGGYFYAYGNNNRAIYASNTHSTGWAGYFVGNTYIDGNVIINESGTNNHDFRVESDTRTHMLWVDASENLVRFGTNNTGRDFANGSTISGVVANYVADFDNGSASGTTIGIGSIELLIDAVSETSINNRFSPTSFLNRDLGFSTTLRAWDDVYADNFVNVSDRREKEEIVNLTYGLKEVLQMQHVSYYLKRDPFHEHKIGLIAQDVLTLVPEAVKTHDHRILDESTMKFERVELERMGMTYQQLIPVLVNAIKELSDKVDQQQKEIKDLQDQF